MDSDAEIVVAVGHRHSGDDFLRPIARVNVGCEVGVPHCHRAALLCVRFHEGEFNPTFDYMMEDVRALGGALSLMLTCLRARRLTCGGALSRMLTCQIRKVQSV
eukprot:GHVU01147648.1.p1 GENE.GHVU01147648.1~~GHVU01147648.1.p1  ORF type:complete len:104 (-),score=5.18 GHVU01147648.1:1317-1628(-)